MKLRLKISVALMCLCVFWVFGLVGGLERDNINFIEFFAWGALTIPVMGLSILIGGCTK